jgi:uncharacterized membrane protein
MGRVAAAALAGSRNIPSKRRRIANEVPTVAMVAIVILVVVKPF